MKGGLERGVKSVCVLMVELLALVSHLVSYLLLFLLMTHKSNYKYTHAYGLLCYNIHCYTLFLTLDHVSLSITALMEQYRSLILLLVVPCVDQLLYV